MYLLLCNTKKLLEKTENLHRQIITASRYNSVYVCSHSLQHWDRISITSPVWISEVTLNIITVLILNFRLSTYISLSLHANVQWGWGWENQALHHTQRNSNQAVLSYPIITHCDHHFSRLNSTAVMFPGFLHMGILIVRETIGCLL